ncbi:NAD(P)(+) transhydrogenase (Re/Si-specific) subunit beta [Candidatus Haliotispira prima]|uniref:NAD(P) transhydrogenase subunit beta n=1 Tax=Candidatus Haliotispira prima TaxID=3034016 RepID=A0ABY8ME37_9SPIO|nr:NAD(P)(+) transhydrogenase (Re/Si-specific) subunit beta [Candidatus Haliotispira prima]
MGNYLNIFIEVAYLIGIILFVDGLKKMSNPKTARIGNLIGALGMAIGILVILFVPLESGDNNYIWILLALLIGGVIGYIASVRVALTAMPEMVSLFNGLGGGCSMFIGLIELFKVFSGQVVSGPLQVTTGLFAIFVGAITLTGSLVAWGKLSGKLRDKLRLPVPQLINLVLLIACIVFGVMFIRDHQLNSLLIFLVLAMVYGFTFVTPIGGGDMPVVISLLNSFSGIAAAISGLLYNNRFIVVGGILVGASGIILTALMCRAMNRSLINVLIGGFGSSSAIEGLEGDQTIREVNYSDLAIQLKYAGKVIVVPGYGLAAAQAQHACYELEKQLESDGVQFYYGIHPVAGRMPGHMNVLLAEAQVPYDKLLDMEPANEQFPTTDVVLVIGANDVVNPAAKDSPGCPIYGMPILEVDKAKTVVILKRSMSAGYAGVSNPLFFKENTRMMFGDAKDSLAKIKTEIAGM